MTAAPSAIKARQGLNFAVFLGPALILLLLFFIAPVLVDLSFAFTDMGRTLDVSEVTTKNFVRMVTRDARLSKALG